MSDEVETSARPSDDIASTPNEAQAEYWNGVGGENWTDGQAQYDAQLDVYAGLVVDAADPAPNDRVLDIGCGTGATTRMAAKKATSGRVFGVDISETMLATARSIAAECEIANVEFLQADAQTDALPQPVDHVVSRFGVMFFEDPVAAFTNIRSALTPTGRLTFVVWRSPEENEWLSLPGRVVAPILGEQPPIDPNLAGPFSLADKDRLSSVVELSGFSLLGVSQVDAELYLGGRGSVEHAVDFSMNLSRMSIALEQNPGAADDVRSVLTEALSAYHDGTGVKFSSSVWLVTAENS